MQIAIPSASTPEPAKAASPSTSPGTHSAQSTANLISETVLFSASAGGKTYPADVALSVGLYTAVVPQLPGLTARANTLLGAEHSLQSRISVFV